LAERGYETLLTYDTPKKPLLEMSPVINPLEVIHEENKRENTPEAAKRISMVFKKKQPVQFTVNTGMCRSELELI
jgi:hypothetical protein